MDNPFSAPTEALTRTDASLINILTEMGTSSDKSQYTMPGVSVKFSDNQLETLHEQPLINAYCSAIPDAAISKPLEFNFGSKNGDLDAKKSSEIIDWLDDFHVLEKTARAQTYANVYGGAAIVYFVDDGQPQDEPLNLKKVKKLLGTRVLDRQRVIPYIETATTLEDISHYDVSTHGVKIGIPGVAENAQIRFHKSRIIPFYGLHLTDNAMLQRYNGWGKSMIEAIWESYRDYRTAILASSGNLGDSSLAIVSMDGFIEMLRANDTETIKSVFASVKNMASNQGMMLIDKTKQDIRYVERQFTGVSQVIDKLREDFIGNSRIQHDKLFGESPSGLGATGEAEEKNWAKEVRQFQERRWRRLLRKQYEILLSLPESPLKGKMPEQWSFKFPSIIELGEDQELANRATQSTIDSTYQSLGILTTDEIRQSRFAGSKFSYETTLDEKAYEEAKKKAEEEAAGYGGFGGYGDFGAGEEEQAIAPEEAPAEAVPEEEAPLQTDSVERQKRLDAMRPSCMDCVTKHLGSALIKGREVENGYPEHIILVVGELSEAEQEVEAISQEAADMIRDLRRDCWARRRSPKFEEVLAIYDVLGYDWGRAENDDYEQEVEVPSYRNPYEEEAIDSIRNWDSEDEIYFTQDGKKMRRTRQGLTKKKVWVEGDEGRYQATRWVKQGERLPKKESPIKSPKPIPSVAKTQSVIGDPASPLSTFEQALIEKNSRIPGSKLQRVKALAGGEAGMSQAEALALGHWGSDGFGFISLSLYDSNKTTFRKGGVSLASAEEPSSRRYGEIVAKAAAKALDKIPAITEGNLKEQIQGQAQRLLTESIDPGHPEVRHIVEHLDEPYKGSLTRYEKATEERLRDLAANVGGEYIPTSFFATTIMQADPEAFSYAREANLRFSVDADLSGEGQGKYIDPLKESRFEGEVLYPPLSKFEIIEIDDPIRGERDQINALEKERRNTVQKLGEERAGIVADYAKDNGLTRKEELSLLRYSSGEEDPDTSSSYWIEEAYSSLYEKKGEELNELEKRIERESEKFLKSLADTFKGSPHIQAEYIQGDGEWYGSMVVLRKKEKPSTNLEVYSRPYPSLEVEGIWEEIPAIDTHFELYTTVHLREKRQ